MEQRTIKQKLEQGFVDIHLGKNKKSVDLNGYCFWVPASVRHEAVEDETSGLARHSFFVYGGVSAQPRINITRGGGGTLGGNRVGGNNFNRQNITRGFQQHHMVSTTNKATRNHDLFRLAGINPNARANMIYLPSNPASHPIRSIHSGRHTNSYSTQIASKMNSIIREGRASNWSQQQYRAATRAMLADLRQEFRAGNIGLNKNHRPWAKKW